MISGYGFFKQFYFFASLEFLLSLALELINYIAKNVSDFHEIQTVSIFYDENSEKIIKIMRKLRDSIFHPITLFGF